MAIVVRLKIKAPCYQVREAWHTNVRVRKSNSRPNIWVVSMDFIR